MTSQIRRGLPRVEGGEAWPPEGTATPPTDFLPSPISGGGTDASTQSMAPSESVEPVASSTPEGLPEPAAPAAPSDGPIAMSFRRGLPRVEGGEPWPPADAIPQGRAASTAQAAPVSVDTPSVGAQSGEAASPSQAGDVESTQGTSTSGPARRGLPRVEGGELWPPEGTVVAGAFQGRKPTPAQPAPQSTADVSDAPSAQPVAEPTSVEPEAKAQPPTPKPVEKPSTAQPVAARQGLAQKQPSTAASPGASQPKAASQPATGGASAKEAKRYGPFTIKQWVGAGAVIALAIVGLVTLVVLGARWFAGLDFMQTFLNKYPGEYELPDSAPVGFPGWLGWQHFFNIFLMLLVIRSGILVRTQERPPAYWTSKRKPKKISIQLWFHQSLNLLWIINGVIFIILLFATGQWMRVIPTSPEVFPNAASALLQYLTLDWPLDNGWVNYNSLQQLAYFLTIFVAAPLSAITGYRMSEAWPEKSKLSQIFSIEGARKLHFPLMIYFVGFIVVHVALVFSTGALRNLNHMFAAQGSPDPSVYADNWTGFWLFVASMVVVVGGWVAARPMIMAPIARIFGNVSAR